LRWASQQVIGAAIGLGMPPLSRSDGRRHRLDAEDVQDAS
jgi:hypothetical protein